ncbi:DNA-directed RNA polymerase [Apiospora arundinis]|uniref:DNA-directed RNA polymerase n=1 Tax=Apiospora arundinis TaxID=335852 RepID=A0ABR2J4X9_9PEZI
MPSANEDTSMADVSALPPTSAQKPAVSMSGENVEPMEGDGLDANGEAAEPVEEEEVEEAARVRILPGSSETAASFEFLEEGHTLGNALRYIIMKNPEVEFCAYSIPHPSEAKMNIRIQTYDTTTATAALEKGLQDLEDLCDVVGEKFWNARNKFNAEKETAMQE